MADISKADQEIISEAQKNFDRAETWESDWRRKFKADMQFANGDSDNGWQWDDATSGERGNRPTLTINKTRTHNLQIVNDARQNKAAIRISPVGDEATYESAKIFEGVCRHIEYISQATAAYDTATYNQVYGGMGYWRVLTDYAHDDTTDLEIFIRRIPDPMSIYLDPDIQQYDGSDAKWGFVFRDMTKKEFKAQYPQYAEEGADMVGDNPINNTDGWNDEFHTRVAEYYRVGVEADVLHLMSDGGHIRESQLSGGKDAIDQLGKFGIHSLRSREVSSPKIEWFMIAGDRIIDRKDWPGRFIPIVRVPCEETVIDNKLDRVSHTRHLRDPQRLYNWYSSRAAEFVALQGKSPFIAPAEAIEGAMKDDWDNANIENKSVLTWNHQDEMGRPIPEPKRAEAPVMAQAYMEGLKIAQAEMMMATGQYQAVMGEQSNETSGKAINARQRQGDNATYHVIDHLAGAIRFTGRILIDLIPKIYDTQRVIMIMAENGDQSAVHVDPNGQAAHAVVPAVGPTPQQAGGGAPMPSPMVSPAGGAPLNPQGQPDPQQAMADAVKTIWNPKVGRYDVVAEVGPAYATRRAEAFNAYSQMMAQNRDIFPVIGDLMMKSADFPGADEMAERLRNMVPPQALGGPPPEVLHLQQEMTAQQGQFHQMMQAAQQQVIELKQQLRDKSLQHANTADKNAIDDYRAETDRLTALGNVDPMLVQMISRQLWENMQQTNIVPQLSTHAAIEQSLQPPAPVEPEGQPAQ